MNTRIVIAFIFSLLVTINATAQQGAAIYGRITNTEGYAVELFNISIPGEIGTSTDEKGNYKLEIPTGRSVKVFFSHLEYGTDSAIFNLKPNQQKEYNLRVQESSNLLSEVRVTVDMEDAGKGLDRIPPKTLKIMPSVSQSIESALIGMVGVSKGGGELSSQYSVRGGNFDENMVYVNDIEVYRPFLIRSGQQEGLSFTNPDLVSSILFSAGGFEAKYGDKMSSVLDIKYRKPSKFASSVMASILGGSVHLEGCSDNHRFTHISGFRYKTSQYMLSSMETKGEYNPSFIDFQTYLTYDITTNLEVSFLGNIAQNKYNFIPDTLETAFGTINEALDLKIYFDGQEEDKYTSYMGALATTYRPALNKSFKLIASAYQAQEEETYDILGQYYINVLDRELGSDNLGDSLMNIGIGTFLNHARNYLDASVMNLSHKAYITNSSGSNLLQWGVKYQHEIITDQINEWQMLDSSGYSLPYSDTAVNLYYTLNANNHLESNRYTGYIQDEYKFELDSAKFSLTAGIRGNYWDFNRIFVVSPRINLAIEPNWKKSVMFRLAAGYYYQPPFYKELRAPDGEINSELKPQKSIHYVVGLDYYFKLWNRPFKYVTELYYKKLDNLVPYSVDQVRIRYEANNNAVGYAAGIDMKINGQFVKGVDSWASISVMRTKEDLLGDSYYKGDTLVYPGYVRRPSDQLVNFGLFFQDYIPKHPSYKVHLILMFGSGLPYGPPKNQQYRTAFKMTPYKRVDIGFSKEIVRSLAEREGRKPIKFFRSLWISAEVFNLLNINNTISHLWVTDIYGRQLAVPNRLTSRRLNIKLIAKF